MRCGIFFILIALMTGVMNAETLDNLIPRHSTVLDGYNDIDSIKAIIDQRGPAGIEGIWELAGTQSTVVIEPCTAPSIIHSGIDCLQIVVIASPRRSIRPGTVLGYMTTSAKAGTYDARLYTENIRSVLQSHRRYIMQLSDDGHMSMTAVKPAWRLTLRQTFKFLIRAGITRQNDEKSSTEGFIKQYPPTGIKPLKPVYL